MVLLLYGLTKDTLNFFVFWKKEKYILVCTVEKIKYILISMLLRTTFNGGVLKLRPIVYLDV